MTIAATPYLVKDPTRVAARLAAVLGRAGGRAPAQARAPRHRLRLPRPQGPGRAAPRKRAGAGDRGPRVHPGVRPRLPARLDGLAAARHGRAPTATGLAGLEYSLDERPARPDGERRLVKDALGRPDRAARDRSATARGRRRPAHDRRQHPGQGRGGARRGGRGVAAQGRHRDRHGPARRRAARARQLAARERQRARRARPTTPARTARSASTYEPGSTFKAFTVAGALEDGKVTPDTEFSLAADDHGRRPRDRRVAPARLRHAHHARDPRAVLERRRDQDRPAARRRALRPLGAALRLRQPTGIDLPGRGAGHHARRSSKYSGSSMGNLPIGQGLAVTPMQMATAYAAIANGGILRPPHVVAVGRRPAGAQARGPPRDVRGHRGVGAAHARGRARPGRHRVGRRRSRATCWRARPAPRRRRTRVTGGYSEDQVRRLVRRLRARQAAEAARHRDGRRAAGRDLRRPGRRRRPSGRSRASR